MNVRLAAATVAYIATIPAANWAIQHFGPVPVGFGYLAPAGVYFAGLALVLRDVVRELSGPVHALAAVVVGTLVSYLIADPLFALASAAAFLLSELLDSAVYEPLRRRGLTSAVVASNGVGLLVDSVAFLWLAFGSFAFLPGQLVGKVWATALAVTVIATRRRAVQP